LATAANSIGWPAAEEYQDWKAGRSGQARTDLWVEAPRARNGWALELKYGATYNLAGSDPKLQIGGRLLRQWSFAVADASAIRKKYPRDGSRSYSDVWAGLFLALATRVGEVTGGGRAQVRWLKRPRTASWAVADWKAWAAREAGVLRQVVTDRGVLKKFEVPGWRGVPLASPEFVGFSPSPRFGNPVRESPDGVGMATGRTWIGFFFLAARV
jgi:hypothetical protein